MSGNVRNISGGGWLLADMTFNICSLSIVKALGMDFPAAQLVFLRAATGLLLMLPWIALRQDAFRGVSDLRLHALRIALSTATLTASYFAVARVPLALFTAINFTRPFVLMALAALLLRERVPPVRWLGAGVGFAGVLVAVNPGALNWSWGLPALLVAIICGSGAIIVTRRLSAAPTVVLMALYALGLIVLTGPFALTGWVDVSAGEWPVLLAMGAFAQCGQFCFLNAHKLAEAGFLAVLGYLSLVLSTGVGYLFFDEVPTLGFWIGASMIVVATLATSAMPTRSLGSGAMPSRPSGQHPPEHCRNSGQ